MPVILGAYPLPLVAYTHDASSALVDSDGTLLWAFEEEKLSRNQYSIGSIPERASLGAFSQTGIGPERIDVVAFASMEGCFRDPELSRRSDFVCDMLGIDRKVERACIPHHLAHSALSVLTSPFQRCAFLTLDGGGDGLMGHWGVFDSGEFRIVETLSCSPALFYAYACGLAGFHLFEEGKLMGLAAYASPVDTLLSEFQKRFQVVDGGTDISMNPGNISWEQHWRRSEHNYDAHRRHKIFPLSISLDPDFERHVRIHYSRPEIAASAQAHFEYLMSKIVMRVRATTGEDSIACSGGAFQNVVANGRLRKSAGVRLHVPLAPGDAGLALGAALFEGFRRNGVRARASNGHTPFLGPDFRDQKIHDELIGAGMAFSRLDDKDIAPCAAEIIADGKILLWFQGRAEFGPRALGGRSILGDPRRPLIKARVNQYLKRRDWFMPFAPAIAEECGNEYFECFEASPYMNAIFNVLPSKSADIIAAVHVDGTCRAQSVTPDSNRRFYDVILSFKALTGIPVVLNTSMNRHGWPMVATPKQAIECFLSAKLDAAILGNYLILQKGQEGVSAPIVPEHMMLEFEHIRRISMALKNGADPAEVGSHDLPHGINITEAGAVNYRGIRMYEKDFDELDVWNAYLSCCPSLVPLSSLQDGDLIK
jgi:carbamoyltransferase